ncbi:ABC transporter substrate-binding protein [Nitrogeniibacter aestuarii]|uniref:ABC transporter substrate-binding protein n=1 Tax=Nitrogeniibacter aestuarii TaxID=2815343 RepID=UPI001E628B4C|nr:ABC transporter substrate-binding protein [Nitrogeniibacter aestuarii]
MKAGLPERIVCLSTETVEVLYALGEASRIAGISGFTVRPARARKEKPKVSGFSTARIDRILAVRPDLVLAFSDLQADMCADLIRAGVAVHVFNHRSVEGIYDMILTLGRLVDATTRAQDLVNDLKERVNRAVTEAARRIERAGRRPRVYFEEWDSPRICGIGWVSEIITLAGGEDIFAERSRLGNARDRIIADDDEIITKAPDVILASWCGKKVRPESIAQREGWSAVPAVQQGQIREIKSAMILSPGPAAIEEGLDAVGRALNAWAKTADQSS